MNESLLIFGNGQLGNFYKRYFEALGIKASIATADITKTDEIKAAFDKNNPTVVINTAAKTNLEWCQNNQLETFNVNVLGASNLAEMCDQTNTYFIHLSSGCIFESKDENDAKTEDDIPAPASYYSWTKVWSEQMITFRRSNDFKYLILRPRQPISSEVNYKNMLVKLLTFTKFVDTPNTGTVIEDLMEWTKIFIEKRTTGVLNAANEGWSTPYEIALLLKKYVLADLPIEKITKKDLDKLTPNKRVDTILDVSRLKSIVGNVRNYKDALEDTIKKLAENFNKADSEFIKEQLDKTLEQSRARTVVNDVCNSLIKNY